MEYAVICRNAKTGDEVWLAAFEDHRKASSLINNLMRADIEAWVEEYRGAR